MRIHVRPLVSAWAVAVAFSWPLSSAPAAAAVPDAAVEGLQLPVWLVRGAKREPLALGALSCATGTGSKADRGRACCCAWPTAAWSSSGENARFTLDGLARKREGGGLLTATLGVLQGAFRFTTTALYNFRGAREVQVRFTHRHRRASAAPTCGASPPTTATSSR